MRRLLVPLLVLSLALIVALPAAAGTRARSGSGTWADFDGDGYADLYVGVPFDDVSGQENAGSVNVIYGSKRGTRAAGNQIWHRDRPGIAGQAAMGEVFAWAVGAGDFDGDGRDDLAVGIFGAEVNGESGAGAVQVIYGTRKGLRAKRSQLWHQDRPGITGQAESGDRFGLRVAAGDVNGDGFDDLLVGVPGENVRGLDSAGALQVILGGPKGLRSKGSQIWHQGRPGIATDPDQFESFGFEIAVGQFGRGPQMDVAVTVPGEDTGGQQNNGAVHLLFGTPRGLTGRNSQLWHHGESAIPGDAEPSESFGTSLVAGNFGKSRHDDLAISIHGSTVGMFDFAGSVAVLYGGPKGLRAKGVQLWHQDRPGIEDQAELGDGFGLGLGAGDFGRSPHDDLAIGAPFEALTGGNNGVVHVLFGTKRGLRSRNAQLWHQDSPGVKETAEIGDYFGMFLQGADVGRGPTMDLVIGAFGESVGAHPFAGAVHVLHGTRKGLTAKGDRLWHQDVDGIKGVAEDGDEFGILNRFLD